jgi:hypothetical protein
MKFLLPLILAASLHAQTAGMPETVLAQPIPNVTTNQIVLETVFAAHAPGVQEPEGGIGSPIGVSANTVMLSWPPPSEAFSIYQVGAPGLVNRVFARRGMYSTYPHTPAQGTLIWLGPGNYFRNSNPSGKCDNTAVLVLPVLTIPSGSVWNCFTTALTWEAATFSWNATTPKYTQTTTWDQTAGIGQSDWTEGITWDEDIGWWATQAIQWRAL